MGDVRFLSQYERVRQAADAPAAMASMSDEDVIAALAGASMLRDPYAANVLATEAQNRARAQDTIVRTAGEGICAVDREGRLRSMNPAAETLLGYAQGELAGRRLHDAVHADGPWEECAVPRVVLQRGEEMHALEYVLRRKDGTTFPALMTASPVLREGEPEGAVMVFRDVTEAREARRRLEESEQRYRSLFEHNPDAVYSFDVRGNFLSANPALVRLSEYPLEELLRLPFLPLVAPRGP